MTVWNTRSSSCNGTLFVSLIASTESGCLLCVVLCEETADEVNVMGGVPICGYENGNDSVGPGPIGSRGA